MQLTWFDAHLDLAYLAECGRDMLAPLHAAGGPHPPAAVTLPALAEGGVTAFLGTIFTEAFAPGETPEYVGVAYAMGDAQAAHAAGLRQAQRYAEWSRRGLISPGPPSSARVPSCLLLMEGADPIRSPEELPFWVERGVAAVGLTWARGSRYAAGNHGPAPTGERGLTPLGFAMLGAMDTLGVVHDLSHLSWPAMDDLLEATDARVMASHSNCSALFQGQARESHRHLRDEIIREIARRSGVIGINLYSKFLRDPLPGEDAGPGASPWRASVGDAVRHIEHVCELTGGAAHVGLGSDMDGGFGPAWLPQGIDAPRDLTRLAEALRARGWPDADIHAFARENWARFWNPTPGR